MCMGRTHVLSTTTLGLATVAPLAINILHHPMPVATVFAFAGVCGGYGVLPDLDHPQATLARTLGPATKAIATFVHGISGGHRKGTHTVWFAALMLGLVTLLAAKLGKDAELPIAFVGFYLAAMILHLSPDHASGKAEATYLVEAAGATAACYFYIPDWWWLPWTVGFGVVGHIVADTLTVEGVPILYPLAKRLVVRLPLLGHTDSIREHCFAWLLGPALLWVAFATVLGHQWWTTGWLDSPGTWRLAALN